jgi:hypothetical protein
LTAAIGLVLILAALPGAAVFAQNDQRCFPETGFCIAGRIREFWEQNGGLPIFGYPLGQQQAAQIEGRAIAAQPFERYRLELHPENPRPYDVLLGRLGVGRLEQQGHDWFTLPKGQAQAGCRFFPETGHNICGDILAAWHASGLEFDRRRGKSEAENLALFGMPLSEPQTELVEGKPFTIQWFERARFELHPENPHPYNVLLGRLGALPNICGTAAPTPSGQRCLGIWVAPEELGWHPTDGPAWARLKATADDNLGKPKIADQDSDHDVRTLAVALVYARTGDEAYRRKAAGALMDAIGTEAGGRTLALGRNLLSYVIAADLIDLRGYDAAGDERFRAWLNAVRFADLEGRTLISTHEDRPNNWGTHAGASRIATDIYLGDTADLERAAQVFKGYLGDRSAYAGFEYGELDWQADPNAPVGINPAGAMKDGHPIDGVLPDDQRRGGEFSWPPPHENYVWEALQGAVVQAQLLSRAGYDTWNWSDRALLRAVRWEYEVNYYPAAGDDTWIVWVINHAYRTNFPTVASSSPGKNIGYADWVWPQ